MVLLALNLLQRESGIPPVSVVVFIIGAAIFIFSNLFGWSRATWAWDRTVAGSWSGGIGLMILAIGLRTIFGI